MLPELWPVLVGVAFVGFLTSTLFGIGGALVLTPALMLVLPAAEAVSIAAPVMVFNNVFKGLAFRRHIVWRASLTTLITAAPAAVGGALLVGVVDARAIKLAVVALILVALFGERVLKREWRFTRVGLFFAGLPIGFISGICAAAGPPTAIAFKGYGLVKEEFVASVAILAVGMQATKIPAYLAMGTLRLDHLALVGALVVASLSAVVVGRRLIGRFDVALFRRALDVILVLVALSLLFRL